MGVRAKERAGTRERGSVPEGHGDGAPEGSGEGAAGGAAEVFEANGSIVNVQVRRGESDGPLLSTGDLKKLHRWLTMDLRETLRGAVSLDDSALALASTPVFIGQPVEVAETFGVVRIALGAADVRALLQHSKVVTAQDKIVIEKINLVARHFDVLLAAE